LVPRGKKEPQKGGEKRRKNSVKKGTRGGRGGHFGKGMPPVQKEGREESKKRGQRTKKKKKAIQRWRTLWVLLYSKKITYLPGRE